MPSLIERIDHMTEAIDQIAKLWHDKSVSD